MADGLDREGETRQTMSWIWRHGDAVVEQLDKEGYAAECTFNFSSVYWVYLEILFPQLLG